MESEHITIEGPATVYDYDGRQHFTLHRTQSEAALHARELVQLSLSADVFIAFVPRTTLTVARWTDQPQPQEP